MDSEREWGAGGTERRRLEIFVRLNDCGRDFCGYRAPPIEVAAVDAIRVGARSREDVEGGRGMSVSGANQDRIGGDAGACADALADVVGDALSERENVNAGDGDFRAAVIEHERLRGEVVVHAGVAADAIAVADHRETDGRVELYSRGAGVEGTHASLTFRDWLRRARPLWKPLSRPLRRCRQRRGRRRAGIRAVPRPSRARKGVQRPGNRS